jgi:hypothetical protein
MNLAAEARDHADFLHSLADGKDDDLGRKLEDIREFLCRVVAYVNEQEAKSSGK